GADRGGRLVVGRGIGNCLHGGVVLQIGLARGGVGARLVGFVIAFLIAFLVDLWLGRLAGFRLHNLCLAGLCLAGLCLAGLCLAGLCLAGLGLPGLGLPGLCLAGLGLPGYRRGGAAGRWCEADLPAAGPALTSLFAGGRRTPGLRVSGFRVSGLRALALRALGPRTRGLGVAARLGPIRLSRVLSRALLR